MTFVTPSSRSTTSSLVMCRAVTLFAALLATACAPLESDEELGQLEQAAVLPGSLEARALEALNDVCSTAPVYAFSEAIVDELTCMHEDLLVDILSPPRGSAADLAAFPLAVDNIEVSSNAHALLQRPAAEALYRAARARPNATLRINHAFRTPVQQYLLFRQAKLNKCVPAAAKPGSSNHETGIAIDVHDYDGWRVALEAEGFKWFGVNDKWHFDYKGPGQITNIKHDGVKVVQRMWNSAHYEDAISADGQYGAATAERFAMLPLAGLDESPYCGPSELEQALDSICPDREPICVLNVRCAHDHGDACARLCIIEPRTCDDSDPPL